MPETRTAGPAAGPSGSAPAATSAMRSYLLEQVESLRLAVADDDVHDARVACRRIRSAMLEYLPLGSRKDGARARQIALTARDLGRAMSPARDAEVVGEVVRGWAADDRWPRERLLAILRLLRADAEPEAAIDGLDGDLLRLADEVRGFVPADGPAARPAPTTDDLRTAQGRAHARLRARVRRARSASEQPGSGASWHDVRKAAKRLRYAAEVTQAAGDAAASDAVEAAKWLQRVLGDLQDLEIVRLRLAHAGGDVRLEQRLVRSRLVLEADLPSALEDLVGGSTQTRQTRPHRPDPPPPPEEPT